jgi:hypothetical protein
VQATNYLKQQVATSIENSIVQLKDQISIDLLNFELSVVCGKKLLNEDVKSIQNLVDGLAVEIDIALNECFENCVQQMEETIDRGSYEIKLRDGV